MMKILIKTIIVAFVIFLTSSHFVCAAVQMDSLVKTDHSTAVYYLAGDGKRYVFPNEKIYKSWFNDFNNVNLISANEMASMPIGGNVTYRPGIRLVKLQSVPKVYAVSKGGILHWLTSEDIAKAMYGDFWYKLVDDLPDVYFMDYKLSDQITGIFDYSAFGEASMTQTINDDKNLSRTPMTLLSDTTAINSGIIKPVVRQPVKFLDILSVNSGASSSYNDNSWERTIGTKNNQYVQIFEAVIWDNGVEGNPKKLSLYKFDVTFDPAQERYINGGAEWVEYREGYNILNITMPDCHRATGYDYYNCSEAYLDAFERVFLKMVDDTPASHYAIKYLGHGSNGSLFGSIMSEEDSKEFLLRTNKIIGNKLDFLDWGYACSMGNNRVLASEYPYADYIVASDIPRGGYAADWLKIYTPLKPEGDMPRFFSSNKSIRQSLVDLVNSEHLVWEDFVTKEDMVSKQLKQSLSIYDSAKYPEYAYQLSLKNGLMTGDVLNYIQNIDTALEKYFYNLRFYYVSNKDFFTWNEDSNGLVF
ncbi:MAG: hypothetical protein P1P90_04465 [Patescibacteria group bacterium]|nr:hypothetical protein [Patescibacteria group bacterium]